MIVITKNYFEKLCGYKMEEIEKMLGDIDSYYYSFYKVKRDDNNLPKVKNGIVQKRKITPSTRELKDLQNKINTRVLSKVLLDRHFLGGVKNKSTLDNAKLHRGKKYIFQTDISNYFNSVTSKMIYNSLRKKGFAKNVARIVSKITTIKSEEAYRNDCLSQGVPTSTALANIVLEKIVFRILPIIDKFDVTISIWVDDLTLSSDKDFRPIIQEIISEIGKGGFKVARKKTTFRHDNAVITGLVVGPSTIKESDKFRNKDESRMSDNQLEGRAQYRKFIYIN